jgi:hypothetical protein
MASMMIGGGAPRARAKAPGTEESLAPPTVDELTIPASMLNDASAKKLIHFVNEVQEARVALTQNFDSRFSDLVTAGKGEDYPQLVDQFKNLYAACDASLEDIATNLAAMPSAGAASKMVTAIVLEERSRADAHLQVGAAPTRACRLRACGRWRPVSRSLIRAKAERVTCAGALLRLVHSPLSAGSMPYRRCK